jgi:hypothetical protein
MLIVTSSAAPGMAFVFQFAAVSQLLSPPAPVQFTAESSVLGSIHSIRGQHDFDRFALPFRKEPNDRMSIAIASRPVPCRRKGNWTIQSREFHDTMRDGTTGRVRSQPKPTTLAQCKLKKRMTLLAQGTVWSLNVTVEPQATSIPTETLSNSVKLTGERAKVNSLVNLEKLALV